MCPTPCGYPPSGERELATFLLHQGGYFSDCMRANVVFNILVPFLPKEMYASPKGCILTQNRFYFIVIPAIVGPRRVRKDSAEVGTTAGAP